jgi:hypothetical protein
VGREAAREGREAGAGGRDGRGGRTGRTARETGPYVLLGEHLASLQEERRDRIAPQGAQGGEVVGLGPVAGGQRLLEEGEVAGGGSGQRGAVAAEVGHQEGPQPGPLAHRLVERLGEPKTVLDLLGRGGAGVEGEGEGAAEHTQLLHAERHAAAGSVWRGHAATIRANQTNPT